MQCCGAFIQLSAICRSYIFARNFNKLLNLPQIKVMFLREKKREKKRLSCVLLCDEIKYYFTIIIINLIIRSFSRACLDDGTIAYCIGHFMIDDQNIWPQLTCI